MTSVLRQGCSHKNKASITLFNRSINYNSSKEMDNLSAPPLYPKKLDFALEASVFLGLFAPLGPSTVLSLVPKYSENDLQQVFKVVLEALTTTITASLIESSQERFLKTRFLDVY